MVLGAGANVGPPLLERHHATPAAMPWGKSGRGILPAQSPAVAEAQGLQGYLAGHAALALCCTRQENFPPPAGDHYAEAALKYRGSPKLGPGASAAAYLPSAAPAYSLETDLLERLRAPFIYGRSALPRSGLRPEGCAHPGRPRHELMFSAVPGGT